MSLYPEDPEIGEVFNNRQWNGTAWVALNNPLSVEYTTDGAFTQHTSASANVHGIINSASVVYADDAKLSDERTPLNQSVTDSKIVAGGLSASVISGSAVVQNDLDSYLTQNSASSTYLTQASASATYASSASPTFTGTVALPLTTNYDGTQLDTRFNEKLNIANQQSNRNLLYNGAMQVHQRGTSTTGITSAGYYTADRWRNVVLNAGTWTESIESDAPTGSGFRKSWKTLCTTADAALAAGDLILFSQRLEGQDLQRIAKGTSSAQQLTASFWVKSNVTGTYICELEDLDNSRFVGSSYAISASGTWEKKTITFPADTTGAFDNDNANSLRFNFFLGAGSDFSGGPSLQTAWGTTVNTRAVGQVNLAAATNNYWQITGVQLEVGPSATEFEFKSFGQELAECQRYYFRVVPVTSGRIATGFNSSTAGSLFNAYFPTEMRVAPTALEQSGTAADYAVAHGNFATTNLSAVATYIQGSRTNATLATTVASGLTAGQGSMLLANNTNAYLAWSAEL